ncbi:LTA synthase family protein [Planococcus sp. YIM B11945]|uniref:LTA synthase family protein n=1 Tax=Planococcus sp. YIM B11945 TaxID=3435410 RepID=UPI003D7C8273
MTKLSRSQPIAVSLSVVSLLLLIKLAVFRHQIYGDLSVIRLVFVEFPMWMLIPALVFAISRKINFLVALVYNLIVSALLVAILWYDRYFMTIPSYFDLKQSGQAGSVMETVNLLYSPWDALFFLDIFVYIAVMITVRKVAVKASSRKKLGAAAGVLLLFVAVTTILALQKPMLDVALFAKEQGFGQTQLAQAYHRGIGKGSAQVITLTDPQLEELKGNKFVPYEQHDQFGVAEGRHLFTIQVESLQGFAINQTIDGQEITPHLNELLNDSLYFNQMFQQIGAGNTSDAEWLLHTSLYPKGMEPTVNFLNGEKIPSLVHLLNDREYYTTTYHADKLDYWNRKELYPSLGFQKAYSKVDIPQEDVLGLGTSDKGMFKFAEEEIKKQHGEGKNIYANLITLTSHTPFAIPKDEQLLKLPKQFEDTYTGNYLQSLRYADEAIGQFIAFLKQEGLYEQSVIVVNGDHSGLHGTPMTTKDNQLMAELLGRTYTIKDRFTLPFIVAGPGLFDGEIVSHFGGQIDMMPTILNLFGIKPETPMIGHNMLQYENNLLTMRYYLSGGSLMTGEEILLGENARFPKRYYNFETMKRIEAIPDSVDEKSKSIQEIVNYSDMLLKQYLNEEEDDVVPGSK